MPDEDSMSTGQAASFLGVHPRTVQEWAAEGFLPGWRTRGERWRFNRSDLERVKAERSNQHEASA